MQMNGRPLGVYLHVPFCTRKCPYCHFYVIPDKSSSHETLVQSIAREWEMVRPQNFSLETLYFGGGTPILLGAEHLAKLLALFPATAQEITIEANPENVTFSLMRDLKLAGFNRVSIGIQSLDDSLLKKIGRKHTALDAKQAVEIAHSAGFSNITIDLMYDLPGQTVPIWQKTLREANKLPITHISLYNLQIEPGTLFAKYPPKQPSSEISAEMYKLAQQELSLTQYEISAFAKQGFQAQHNTRYWKGDPFLGLGPSAFSFYEGKRFQNTSNLSKYARLLNEGKSPIDFEEELPYPANIKELFTIQLRLLKGVKTDAFSLPEETLQALKTLENQGLIEVANERYRLTERGILFYDSVAIELIE